MVSAVSGVTELLLAAIEQSKQGEKNIPAILARLTQKHRAIIDELGLTAQQKTAPVENDQFPIGPGPAPADRHRLPRRPDPGGQGQAAELRRAAGGPAAGRTAG